MNFFEESLWYIHKQIALRKYDIQVYTNDFEIIRDYLLRIMCSQDSMFNEFYSGTFLFGSHANNLRINRPDEFDVLFLLNMPHKSLIRVEMDLERPGFVKLDFQSVMNEVENQQDIFEMLESLVDWENDLLRATSLKHWIRSIIRQALKNYGTTVKGCNGDCYNIVYDARGVAHTLFAHCPARKMSIDFVPAIILPRVDWVNRPYNRPFSRCNGQWYATPKMPGGCCETRKYAFMLCNSKAEHKLLMEKQNLKIVFRLLKSIRDKYHMPKMKSYFFTTAFLWEIENECKMVWSKPIDAILVHMLDLIAKYFEGYNLPYFWNCDLNLLDILSLEEIEEYGDIWRSIYNKLKNYHHNTQITYKRIAGHFEILFPNTY